MYILPQLFTTVSIATVPECTVAPLVKVNPLSIFEQKVTFAPFSMLTYPPFSMISNAVPPLETIMEPPEFTVVLVAVPPLKIFMIPSEFTVVLFATPPFLIDTEESLAIVLFTTPPSKTFT